MPAVPGDEIGGRDTACEILARDAESAVTRSTVGEDDCIEVLMQLGDADIGADLEVAHEADSRLVEDLVEGVAHRADAVMIGGDAVAHEAKGHGQLVDDVDGDGNIGLADQGISGIHARRA